MILIANNDTGMATVRDYCQHCKIPHTVVVPIKELLEYQRGEKLLQDAMPSVSVDDREFIKSGICPTCWEELFRDDD